MSKSLLRSTDFYRLTKAVDCESIYDQGILSWAATILLTKIIDYDRVRWENDPLEIRPEAVQRGLRMLIYREEFEKWREKHQSEMNMVSEAARSNDMKSALDYLTNSISTLTGILNLF